VWNATGFLRNDLDYAPFGIRWLRGLTPARLGVVFLICLVWGLAATRRLFFLEEDIFEALWAWRKMFFSMLAGFLPMVVLVIRAEATTREVSTGRRVRALALAVFVGALAYVGMITLQRSARGPIDWPNYWEWALMLFSRSFTLAALGAAILFWSAREREARRRLHEAEKARIDTDRQLAEVRLQLLQAQIEPHFMFNSLASVKRLYQTDPGEAGRLLRNLKEYLRAAAINRGPEARLGDEIALAQSFLRIFQVRMSERLRVSVDVPAELGDALVPSFMIGTLVENAIKHGLAPRGSGGTITLRARAERGVLAVDVADDGVGFREHCGVGVGLANTRARLHSLFGAAAGVAIISHPGGGVTASLRLPHRVAPLALAA
jgi:sensor histidine kinase YesM